MIIYTVGRGKHRKVKSFGAGSVNEQMAQMMCISDYAKQCAATMGKVERNIYNERDDTDESVGTTD